MTATFSTGIRKALVIAAIAVPGTLALAGAALAAPKAPPAKTFGAEEQRRAKQTPIGTVVREATPMVTPQLGSNDILRRQESPDGPKLMVDGTGVSSGSSSFTAATTQNGAWSGAFNANPNRQVGKLYYDVMPGVGVDWRHCTATAINSENKSLVLTAGHCVFNPDPDGNGRIEGNGYWYESVQFCPGFEYSCRLGVWYARNVSTTSTWFYGSGNPRQYDWRDDVAVVLVSPHATKGRLVNAVGGHGISFNASTALVRHAFGYPVNDYRWPEYTYDGGDLIYCRGRDASTGTGHLRIACTMTGGASGGPWITSPNAQWFGYVNSVNSHKPWGGPYMGGPYFGNAEKNLFAYWRAR